MATPLSKGLSSKRARSTESFGLPDLPQIPTKEGTPEPPNDSNDGVPTFLRQSKAEISSKFLEVKWQEQLRIVKGRTDPKSGWVLDSSPQVLLRDRYLYVQPWDNRRIRLKVGEGMLDYINASPIVLKDPNSGVETKYIATQGPKKSSMSHFWQMIWQETGDTAVIVMLTPTEEAGMEKCFQYFPLNAESSPYTVMSSGHADHPLDGQVVFVETEEGHGTHTQVRKLHLTFGERTKIVWHLLFTAIADFGVPEIEDRGELLDLVKLSVEKNGDMQNPRIIHCSAGVGRSGTFIALEHLIAQLDSGAITNIRSEEDPIFLVVQQLREQRMMMVQSDLQFQFLYDILAERLKGKRAGSQLSDQPSPKLRRLSGRAKAPMPHEAHSQKGSHTSDIKVDCAQPVEPGDDAGHDGVNPEVAMEEYKGE